MIGRRGVVQTAFTIKEIREVSKIQNLRLFAMRDEFEASLNDSSQREMHADFSINSRACQRKTEFLKSTCTFLETEDQVKEVVYDSNSKAKSFILRYLLNPVELIGSKNHIEALKLQKMTLSGAPGS